MRHVDEPQSGLLAALLDVAFTNSSAFSSRTSSISSSRSSSSSLASRPAWRAPARLRRLPRFAAAPAAASALAQPCSVTPYDPSRSSSSAAVVHSSNNLPTWAAVPRSGSIIGTRRSGSAPTSNTSESQLAATMSSGHFCRQRPGSTPGWTRAVRSWPRRTSSSLGQPLHAHAGRRATCRAGRRGTGGRGPAGGRRPSRGRGGRGSRRTAAAWPPSRAGRQQRHGSASSAVSTCSQRWRTSAPTSSPTDSSPRSRAYFWAGSSSCHCTSSAVTGAVASSGWCGAA